MQKYRSYILPIAIVLGLFFHSYIKVLSPLVPYLISIMLFFTYSSIQVRKMHLTFFDFWLILFQLMASIGLYFLIKPFNNHLAQGILVTILTPTATSAVVVAVMLGANLTKMGVYTLFSNFVIALAAPLYFTWIGTSMELPFWESFGIILAKISPLLILPFLLAVCLRKFLPKINIKIVKIQSISFYLWALALFIVIAKVINFIFEENTFNYLFLLWASLLTLALCVIQFALGKYIGKRFGDEVAGGQSLGQKNTVLAIWMAQTFLNPVSSVIPALYVVLQNVYNSFQLWKKETNHRKRL